MIINPGEIGVTSRDGMVILEMNVEDVRTWDGNPLEDVGTNILQLRVHPRNAVSVSASLMRAALGVHIHEMDALEELGQEAEK